VPSRTKTKLGTLVMAKRSKASGSIWIATCWADQALDLGNRVAQRTVGEAPDDDGGLGPRRLVDQTLQCGAGHGQADEDEKPWPQSSPCA
jgi:hypothetical protein